MVFIGRVAASKLSTLTRVLTDKTALKRMFAEHDSDGDGALEYKEFASLVKKLGVEFSQYEMDAACFAVDQDDDQKISEQEFLEWWDRFQNTAIENAHSMV